MQQKGIAYAIIFHIFGSLFLASVFKVMFTEPGRVSEVKTSYFSAYLSHIRSKQWNSNVEDEITRDVEKEKFALRQISMIYKAKINQASK